MALRLTLGKTLGIDTGRFTELSALVARASGRTLPVDKPIIGAGVFRHESGIHVRGLLADRRSYEPFPAEAVGHRETEFIMGKHSGRAAVRHALSAEATDLTRSEVEGLLASLRVGPLEVSAPSES